MSATVVKHLNVLLRNELTAINQYFLHAKLLKHQGFMKLSAKEYEESIDEMKHAEQLVDRILYIGGTPDLQRLGKIYAGNTPKEMLEGDLKAEEKALKDLKEAAAAAEEADDRGSLELIEAILISEEEHVDWLNTQLRLIDTLGEAAYLQTQVVV